MNHLKSNLKLWAILIIFISSGFLPGSAQDRYIISRIHGTIKFDGISDEAAWKEIKPLPMIMHIPRFGNQPSERTDVLIAYDNEYLYIGGRFFDREPSKIQAVSKKRDFIGVSSDWFGIILDTFNDKENAVAFFTTPTGQRLDVTVFNDAVGDMPINSSWNTFWDVKTVTNDQGWFIEMRIPFSSLRFQEKDGEITMGLIAWRWIPHKNERIIFPAIPNKWGWWGSWKPSQAQEVVFQGIQSRNPLYIAPYVLAGAGRSFNLNESETAYQRTDEPTFEAGLDVKYGLTSNLTLDLTLNTDFAQVEADDQQVNLTRFSLFFPEKRLFFQERSSNFEFGLGGPNRLFYSRRIGIHEGRPVRIYGGARIVGRVGRWDIGFLNMQTAPIEELISQNFGVLRLRRQVINPNSYVGGILTSKIGTDKTYNIAYGLDGIFRVLKDDYLQFHWAQTFDDDIVNNPSTLNSARIGIGWERRTIKGLGYWLNYSRAGKDFNPELGFMMRDDYSRVGGRVLYGWTPSGQAKLLRHYLYWDGFAYMRNSDRKVESAKLGPGWNFNTKEGLWGNISFNAYYENVPDTFSFHSDVEVPAATYSFLGMKGFFATPMGNIFNTMLNFDAGSFYDGWRVSLSATPTWSISSDFELSGYYQYNRVSFPDRHQQFTAHIARVKALWMLSISLSVSAFIQYNSAIDAVITNVRLRYNPREGNDFYLVYDEGLNTHRDREFPVLPITSNRTLLLKYTYTFNL